MGAIQEIFRQFAPTYVERFAESMPGEHHKVIKAILACRGDSLGSVCYRCEDCGHHHIVPAACGNRHCPQCQHRKSRLWLERQLEHQLPGHHFMLTFTVPEPLRALLRSHQRIGYAALFQSSSQAIKNWWPIHASSGAIRPASSACSTPGAEGIVSAGEDGLDDLVMLARHRLTKALEIGGNELAEDLLDGAHVTDPPSAS